MLSLEEIKEIDGKGIIEDVLDFPEMCEDAFQPIISKHESGFEKIGVVGMGGSGIGGDMLESFLKYKTKLPVLVNKNYRLPASFDEKTLLFVVSYSGNTEETISCLREGIKRGSHVCCISSDGEVETIAHEKNIPLFKVEKEVQPRAGFPYLFLPILATLEELDVVEVEGFEEAVSNLFELRERNNPEIGFKDNYAKKIALELKDSIPVIYSYGALSSVAYRWKCQLNENYKMFAIKNDFPELTHNEVVGLDHDLINDFKIMVLREEKPDEVIEKKIMATEAELDKEIGFIEVFGESWLSKLLTGVFLGDLVSVYLAVLRGVDPTPVSRIERIKDKLSSL